MCFNKGHVSKSTLLQWTEYVVIEKGWLNSVYISYDDALLCSIAIVNVFELPFNNFRLKTTPR